MTPAAEKPKRGRPVQPPVATLQWLTVTQALKLCRELGRSLSRARLNRAIYEGRLVAYVDPDRLDRFRQPLTRIARKDLDRWLAGSLRPVKVSPLARRA